MDYHGEYLRELRRRNKLTQEKLAKKLYIARQTLSRIESNRSRADHRILLALSSIYGIPYPELLAHYFSFPPEEANRPADFSPVSSADCGTVAALLLDSAPIGYSETVLSPISVCAASSEEPRHGLFFSFHGSKLVALFCGLAFYCIFFVLFFAFLLPETLIRTLESFPDSFFSDAMIPWYAATSAVFLLLCFSAFVFALSVLSLFLRKKQSNN